MTQRRSRNRPQPSEFIQRSQRSKDENVASTSVVIPQWGQFDLTARLVEQLRTHEPREAEIIVVDDGSPDFHACEFADDERVQLVRQSHRGVTAAWNRGARQSRSCYLIFVNNDVEATGPLLDRLTRPLQEKDVAMTGCRWRTERGVPDDIAPHMPRELLEGWCFAVRRIEFDIIGGFDERFRLYFSDTDLQWRLLSQRDDLRLEAVPGLPLVHRGHVSTRTDPRRREHHARDRREFVRKWEEH